MIEYKKEDLVLFEDINVSFKALSFKENSSSCKYWDRIKWTRGRWKGEGGVYEDEIVHTGSLVGVVAVAGCWRGKIRIKCVEGLGTVHGELSRSAIAVVTYNGMKRPDYEHVERRKVRAAKRVTSLE